MSRSTESETRFNCSCNAQLEESCGTFAFSWVSMKCVVRSLCEMSRFANESGHCNLIWLINVRFAIHMAQCGSKGQNYSTENVQLSRICKKTRDLRVGRLTQIPRAKANTAWKKCHSLVNLTFFMHWSTRTLVKFAKLGQKQVQKYQFCESVPTLNFGLLCTLTLVIKNHKYITSFN